MCKRPTRPRSCLFIRSAALRVFAAFVLALSSGQAADWEFSRPGWTYEFPRDHGNHPDFKTEWWYFTGNLRSAEGREFGYQLTFFRQGITPPAARIPTTSRFVTGDVKFAHFAVTDVTKGEFVFEQFLARGTFGEAGFDDGGRLAWIEECELRLESDGTFRLRAQDEKKAIDLRLRPVKPPVIHGTDGVSQKADGEGRASHYYSLTRMETAGTVTLGGTAHEVTGLSWFDHEWATNQLAAGQVGWDWFSVQFDDGTELMLFQIRTATGGRERWSGGTFVDASGGTTAVADADFELEPVGRWKSRETGADYPVDWRLAVPKLGLEIKITARVDDQELRLAPISYWEGSIGAEGMRGAVPVRGTGYLEMTGYAGDVVGMKAAP